MGLPELTFTLKKAAETVSTRISRGAVALILRDAKANGVHVVCQESDIPTTLGADNIAYIKRTLMGYINRPSAVYVSVVPAAGTIAAGFSALAAYTYDYIAGPSLLKTPRRLPLSSRSAASCAISARQCCPTLRRIMRASSTLCLPVSPPAARRLSLPRLTARALRVCWPVRPRSAARPMRS